MQQQLSVLAPAKVPEPVKRKEPVDPSEEALRQEAKAMVKMAVRGLV